MFWLTAASAMAADWPAFHGPDGGCAQLFGGDEGAVGEVDGGVIPLALPLTGTSLYLTRQSERRPL